MCTYYIYWTLRDKLNFVKLFSFFPYLQTYRENVAEKEWATLYQPPYYSKNGKSYLLIAPQRDGKNGKYLHIIKVERDSKPNTSILEHPITLGPFEVKNILAWDESNNTM